jgi:type IV secretion system protein VirB4
MEPMLRPRERTLANYMPLVDHATPRVVLMRDGSALAMFQVDGLPVHTVDTDVLYRTRRSLNHALTALASEDGVVLYSWVCRGFAPPSIYPAGAFRSAFARNLDQRYRERLMDRFLYLNRTYVGIMLRPPRLAGEWAAEQWNKRGGSKWFGHKADDEPPIDRIHRLGRLCEIIAGDLEPYKPRRLGLRERDGRTFSEIAEALAFAMTGVWRSVGLQSGRRLGSLFCERVIVGREAIEIRGPGTSSWAACFGARHMPWRCPPGTLDAFLTTSFRSTVAQSFRLIPVQTALTLIGRQQNRMVSADDKAASQIVELDRAMDEVQSGRMALGDHHLVATIFCDDLAAMPRIANEAWHALQDAGCQVAREDDALEAAYFSMLPGNGHLRPRPGAVTTFNYAAMAGMHAFPAGDETGHWGDPIALFRTLAGTPYRYHLHTGGVGNTFIFGESGSGKSAFLAFLITQCERLGIHVVLFDKDRGLEIVSRAVGGRYLALDHPTGLSWLKSYSDSDEDIHQLARMVRGLIKSAGPYDMEPEEDRRLFVGLRAIMALPPEQRWMTDLRAFLGVSRKAAGARLEKFCWGQEYGWVCDCPADDVRLDAHLAAFDVTRFLNDPMVCGPVMADLLYRTGKLADGRRLLTIVDESWHATDIPAFADDVKDGLKTDRKKNAAVILATQSVRDALESAIGYTIREQCKTIIGFPVERPDRADFKRLRYSDRECEIIEDLKPGTGLFLLRQGGRSVVAQLALAGMTDEMAVLSGNEINVRILDEVRAAQGLEDDPERLIEAFHQRRKVLA